MTYRSFLGWYFCGTGIKKDHADERSMLKEFVTDKQELERSGKKSHLEERIALLIGTHAPNLIIAGSAGALALGYTQPALLILAFGEIGLRWNILGQFLHDRERWVKHVRKDHADYDTEMRRLSQEYAAYNAQMRSILQSALAPPSAMQPPKLPDLPGDEWKKGTRPDEGYSRRCNS